MKPAPFTRAACVAALLFLGGAAKAQEIQETPMIRAGMIGLDTSHCGAFTQLLHRENNPPELQGVRIVAAFPGGSPDLPSSRDRVEKYTEEMRGMGVEIVDSIDELLEKVDVVLLESVDGRPHWEQARPVIEAGKPLFIDKPLAGSLADALRIHRLAESRGVPWFSSSALRFSPGIAAMRDNAEIGSVLGCVSYGPCEVEPHHPDLFWYGVHGVETLFTIMGPGCESVQRSHSPGQDLATGVWKGGRIGSYRGIRQGKADFGALVFGEKGIAPSGSFAGYEPLVVEIVKFFHTKKPPIAPEETLEIIAFMEAADESKRRGGGPVTLAEVFVAAEQSIDAAERKQP